MRLIVVSMPKSGTYLAVELFNGLGLNYTGYHLQTSHYTDYSIASSHDARYYPEKFKVETPLSESKHLIKDGEFAVGHLPPVRSLKKEIADFDRIFICREVRACLFSYFRFLKQTARQNVERFEWYSEPDPKRSFQMYLAEQGERRIAMYDHLSRWIRDRKTPFIRFEWMKGIDCTNIHSALSTLSAPLSTQSATTIELVLKDSIGKKTMTKSEKDTDMKFDICWTTEAESFFKSHKGHKINKRLGYK